MNRLESVGMWAIIVTIIILGIAELALMVVYPLFGIAIIVYCTLHYLLTGKVFAERKFQKKQEKK